MRAIAGAVLVAAMSGCAGDKVYQLRSERPNVEIRVGEIESEFLTKKEAYFNVYDVRGPCDWFYEGYVELHPGTNFVTVPTGKDIIVSFVRANSQPGYSGMADYSYWLHAGRDQFFRLRFRERKGSMEVLFQAKTGAGGEFKEYKGPPVPQCEKLKVEK